MNPSEEDIKIAETALATCTDEYREQADVWKTLETKAQVAITVAGVFLAAAFAYSRETGLDVHIQVFLGVTLLTLLLALLCALWVLKTEDFDLPFNGTEALKDARRLLDPTMAREPAGSRYKQMIESLTDGYEEVLNKIDVVTGNKQKRLGYAYAFLFIAAISATVAGMLALILHGH